MDNKKLIFIFFIGLIIFIFPSFTNVYYEKTTMYKTNNYFSIVTKKLKTPVYNISNEETLSDKLFKDLDDYNKNIYNTGQTNLFDAFSFESKSFDLQKYGIEEDIIGKINIPSINTNLPIYLGASKENMKNGAVLLGCTSIPLGKTNSNSVIAAHRGMGTKAMFRNINKIEIGDEIIITNFWKDLKYVVIDTRVIYPDEIENILIEKDKDLITLVSCNPYRYNYQRYIVIAERAN